MLRLSTILLRVSLSSIISPCASTVIFWVRSPLAMAVLTTAMFLTWLVRLAASMFTLSVNSFQVPATPGTSACAPSLPSTPTSLATLVTSEPKMLRLSTMVLVIVAIRKNSPFIAIPPTSSPIFCVRLPSATAVMTRATSVVGCAKLLMSAFTESIWLAHIPLTAPGEARSVI